MVIFVLYLMLGGIVDISKEMENTGRGLTKPSDCSINKTTTLKPINDNLDLGAVPSASTINTRNIWNRRIEKYIGFFGLSKVI